MASAKYADATDLNAAIAQTTGKARQISVQSPATVSSLGPVASIRDLNGGSSHAFILWRSSTGSSLVIDSRVG